MQINNTLSTLIYDTDISNKNEIDKSNDLTKPHKSEIFLDINNNISLKTNSLHLTNKEIDEKINALTDIKTKLEKPSIDNMPTYDTPLTMEIVKTVLPTHKEFQLSHINYFSDEELKKERDKFIPLLNPNQKFSTQAQKDSFLAKSNNLEWYMLSPKEAEIYNKNYNKAISKGFDTFDKASDFDSITDLVYFEKKRLESSNSLSLNRSFLIDKLGLKGMDSSLNGSFSMTERISSSLENDKIPEGEENIEKMSFDTQMEALNEIEELILKVSEETVSIKEKESLIKEIKNLSKNIDSDLAKKISEDLDTAIDKQKDELIELTEINVNIVSKDEAKRYLDQTEKLDINFKDLSNEEKIIYITNKQNIVNTLISTDSMVRDIENNKNTKQEDGQSLSSINDNLTSKLNQIVEEETNVVKELTGKLKFYSTSEAVDFLEKVKEIQHMLPKLSDNEKLVLGWNKEQAQWAIKENKEEASNIQQNNLIENIDKLIFILENSKEIEEKEKILKKIQTIKKESSSFTSQNIKQQNGSFYLSQSLNSNQNNVIRLVS